MEREKWKVNDRELKIKNPKSRSSFVSRLVFCLFRPLLFRDFPLYPFHFSLPLAIILLNPSDCVRSCKAYSSHILAIGGKERRSRFGTGAII